MALAKHQDRLEIVDEAVRLSPREFDEPMCGVYVTNSVALEIKKQVRTELANLGLHSAHYFHPNGPGLKRTQVGLSQNGVLAEAFFSGEHFFRDEAVLIDDGGRVLAGEPVLSIAVRDGLHENRELAELVGDILVKNDIHSLQAVIPDPWTRARTEEGDETTLVFRLKRKKPDSQHGVRAAVERLMDRVGSILKGWGDPEPVPVPLGFVSSRHGRKGE